MSSESIEGLGLNAPDNSLEDAMSADQQPVESGKSQDGKDLSFEEWLEKEEGKEDAKKPDIEKKPTKRKAKKEPTVEEVIAAKQAKESPEDSDEKPETESEEPVSNKQDTTKVKIGDKEYTTEELSAQLSKVEEVTKQHESLLAQVNDLVEALKSRPGDILGQLGANKEAIEEWYYKSHIEPTLLSPEERQAKADKEELESYRTNAQKLKEEQEAKAAEESKEQAKKAWSERIEKAMSEVDLPRTQYTVSKVAQYLRQAYDNGVKDVQPADVVKFVKEDWINTQKELTAKLSPEELMKSLGEETLAKIRQVEVDKYKQTALRPKEKPAGKVRDTGKSKNKKFSSIYNMLDDL